MQTHKGYCMRCKEKVILEAVASVRAKDGRPAIRGRCTACGRRIFRFVSQAEAPARWPRLGAYWTKSRGWTGKAVAFIGWVWRRAGARISANFQRTVSRF